MKLHSCPPRQDWSASGPWNNCEGLDMTSSFESFAWDNMFKYVNNMWIVCQMLEIVADHLQNTQLFKGESRTRKKKTSPGLPDQFAKKDI